MFDSFNVCVCVCVKYHALIVLHYAHMVNEGPKLVSGKRQFCSVLTI